MAHDTPPTSELPICPTPGMSVPTSIVDYGCLSLFNIEARAAVGEDVWAGSWYDADETVVVMLTDLDRASLITDEMLEMAGPVRFEQAAVSIAELESKAAEFETALSDAQVDVASLWIEPQYNRLVIDIVDGEAVRPIVESIVGTFPVAITYNAPEPVEL